MQAEGVRPFALNLLWVVRETSKVMLVLCICV